MPVSRPFTQNSEDSKKALAVLIKYYTDNASRMRYDECLRLSYGLRELLRKRRSKRNLSRVITLERDIRINLHPHEA